MANMRTVVGSCLILAGMSLGTALAEAPPPEKKGTPVEVLTQDNQWIKLELQEVVPAYNDSTRMSFTKKLEPKMNQIAWFEVPIASSKKGMQIREIRIADVGQKYKDAADGQEYVFYSVVLVPYDGFTASWMWLGESLSGITADKKPISIPLTNVKVVRFPKPSGA